MYKTKQECLLKALFAFESRLDSPLGEIDRIEKVLVEEHGDPAGQCRSPAMQLVQQPPGHFSSGNGQECRNWIVLVSHLRIPHSFLKLPIIIPFLSKLKERKGKPATPMHGLWESMAKEPW